MINHIILITVINNNTIIVYDSFLYGYAYGFAIHFINHLLFFFVFVSVYSNCTLLTSSTTSLIQLLHLFKLLTSSTYFICLFALWPHIESTTAFITLHLSYLLQTLLNALRVLYFDSFILHTTYFTYSNCICLFALWPYIESTTAFIQLYCYSYSHCSFGPP